MSSQRHEVDYFVDKRGQDVNRPREGRGDKDSRYHADYENSRSYRRPSQESDAERRRPRRYEQDERNHYPQRHRRMGDSSREKRGREPSPIGSSISPLDEWPRKLKCWDIPPPGFGDMSAAQVKNTGLFIPATYQPKVTNLTPFVDPARTTFLFQQSAGIAGGDQSSALTAAANPALAKQARRLYVGDIPASSTSQTLEAFFNELMESYGFVMGSGQAVQDVSIAPDCSYAFVDFRSSAEATSALAFDGITYEGHILKVRRPKDYVMTEGFLVTTDGDDEVIAILTSFGELRSFNLVRDGSGFSKGYAFCEYLEPELTDVVVQGLHMFEVGEKRLTVQKAMMTPSTMGGEGMVVANADTASILQSITSGESLFGRQTSVLQLMNMCTAEDLAGDAEYEGIVEDVLKECTKFGKVVEIWIPRPDASGSLVAAIGKTTAALQSLAGRQFLDRNVLTAYFDEKKFEKHLIE